MGKIVLLDELTINQIAAGEVIERPSSVIKEMVENSIDAGATNITVEIKNGGISFIKVTDNGKGIANDDLEIAFERHATSKIRSAEDLDTVTSMGFRGEALASIAAIANVEMISKTQEDDNGYKVIIEGGEILEKTETGCPVGTSITVKNLFFNTPVRYKFLKKDYTESGYIEDIITRIALVHPEISFKLINTGKTVIQTNGSGELKNVIYSIYGKDITEGTLTVDYKYEDIQIKGVIGKPEIARSNRSNQLFFVNQRYIKDKTLSASVEQAYKGMLPIGKFAFVVLDIKIDPSKVDVNVHPAKLEVRFQEENKIFKAIYHSIKDTLLNGDLVADTENNNLKEVSNEEIDPKNQNNEFNTGLFGINRKNIIQKNNQETLKTDKILDELKNLKEKLQKEIDEKTNIEKPKEIKVNEENEVNSVEKNIENQGQEIEEIKDQEIEQIKDQEIKENIENNEITETSNSIEISDDSKQEENQDENIEKLKEQLEKLQQLENNNPEDFGNMYAKMFGTNPISEEENVKDTKEYDAMDIIKDNNVSVFEEIEEYKKPIYKFIGIAFKTYIIIEMDKELYIIDQHAAHERIMYEKVKKNYYSEDVKDSQLLLLPDIITLTHKEMDIAKENYTMFEKAGFVLEEFGDNTIKLSGVPDICVDLDTKELFLETLDEINTVARTAKQEKEERFIATVACKSAVKANMALSNEEVEALMDKLLKLPNPFTCPHGRPTAIKMTKTDIEKKFARR